MSIGANVITNMTDCINNMPDIVISNILNRLPIKEAVRTSSLARNWRFKWTLLTNVIVDEEFFYYLRNKFDGRHVTRLLNQLMGPIRKFVFSVEPKTVSGIEDLNYEEIHVWILFLARQGIEELTIRTWYGQPVTLPTQLYSRMELKHLELHCCAFPTLVFLSSFPNLLSLELCSVMFQTGIVWDFNAGCPSLDLKMDRATTNEMRLWDIAKLKNLKKLDLSFGVSTHVTTITTSNIFHLTSLPTLQTLRLDFQDCTLTREANFRMNVSVPFVSLINLKMTGFDFGNSVMVSLIIEMIRGSPNLKMLDTRATYTPSVLPLEKISNVVDRITIRHGQLQTVVFQAFPRSKHKLTLIKFILACSGSLKTIYIKVSDWSNDGNENIIMNWELARKLLKLHRASLTAVVEFF